MSNSNEEIEFIKSFKCKDEKNESKIFWYKGQNQKNRWKKPETNFKKIAG